LQTRSARTNSLAPASARLCGTVWRSATAVLRRSLCAVSAKLRTDPELCAAHVAGVGFCFGPFRFSGAGRGILLSLQKRVFSTFPRVRSSRGTQNCLEERKFLRRQRSPKSFSRASFCVHLRGAPCVRYRASPATLSAPERDLPRVRSLGVGRFSPRGEKPCSSHQTFRTQGLIRDALRQGNFHILHSLRWTS